MGSPFVPVMLRAREEWSQSGLTQSSEDPVSTATTTSWGGVPMATGRMLVMDVMGNRGGENDF